VRPVNSDRRRQAETFLSEFTRAETATFGGYLTRPCTWPFPRRLSRRQSTGIVVGHE
jgi:hypothetical protein